MCRNGEYWHTLSHSARGAPLGSAAQPQMEVFCKLPVAGCAERREAALVEEGGQLAHGVGVALDRAGRLAVPAEDEEPLLEKERVGLATSY